MRHHESKIQIACVQWFRYQYPKLEKLLIAVPNGGYRNAREAQIMKAEGVISGASDLILLVPKKGFGCLCVEMKTEKGRQSNNQKDWQKQTELNGNKYVICRNIDDFMVIINWYLN